MVTSVVSAWSQPPHHSMTTSSQDPDGPGTGAGTGPLLFAVTGQGEFELPDTRKGTTAFTVTNLTGRPVRARLQPTCDAVGSTDWFKVTGDSEVSMATGATITVEVSAAVPDEVPVGKHVLRLRAIDESDPESVTEGQAVSLTVPPPRSAAKKKLPLIPILAAAVVALVLIGGAVWWFGIRDVRPVNVSAPAIADTASVGDTLTADKGVWERKTTSFRYEWKRCIGKTCSAIRAATTTTYTVTAEDIGASLKLAVTARNSDGSTKAESNQTALVEAPSVTVPNLKKLTIAAASIKLEGLGLRIFAGRSTSCSLVTSQSPAANSEVEPGSSVKVDSIFRLCRPLSKPTAPASQVAKP